VDDADDEDANQPKAQEEDGQDEPDGPVQDGLREAGFRLQPDALFRFGQEAAGWLAQERATFALGRPGIESLAVEGSEQTAVGLLAERSLQQSDTREHGPEVDAAGGVSLEGARPPGFADMPLFIGTRWVGVLDVDGCPGGIRAVD